MGLDSNDKNATKEVYIYKIEHLDQDLLEKSQDTRFNLAFCDKDMGDMNYWSSYGSDFSGIYVEFDSLDDLEITPLYAFTKITHLKIKFSNNRLYENDLSEWVSWICNVDNLHTVLLENLPNWDDGVFENWLNSIVITRKFPLKIIIQGRMAGGPSGKRKNNEFIEHIKSTCGGKSLPEIKFLSRNEFREFQQQQDGVRS